MKKVYVLLFIASLFSYSQAQDCMWLRNFGGTSLDEGNFILAEGNSIYITGNFSNTITFDSYSLQSNGGWDACIAKLDTNGNVIWADNFGSNSSDIPDYISIDNLGNIYVVAHSDYNSIVVKYTTTGTKSFEHIYEDITVTSIATDFSGNYYIGGGFHGTVSIGSHNITSYDYNDDIFLAKVDVSQNVEWVEVAGGEGDDDFASIQWSENNLYIYGDYNNELSFNGTTITADGYFSDLFIAKYSDLGNLIWVSEIKSSNGTEEAYDIKVDENDMLYLTGRLDSYNTINFGSFNLETTDKDVFISQLSPSGVVNWAAIIGNVYSSSYPGYKQSGITTTANHIFSTCFDNDSDKILIHKHEKNGVYVGTYTSGESSGVYGRAIASDNSNRIYMIGKFASTVNFDSFSQTTNGNKDIFVAKVASDFQPITTYVIKINNIETKIYPNPTNGILKIEGENITSVSITDLAGKKLFEKTQIQQKETIDLSEFEMGIYIISIQTDKEIFATKIIKK